MKKRMFIILLAAGLAVLSPAGSFTVLADTVGSVEYENLRELVKAGNITLSQTLADYGDNIAAYQEIWDTLKWEQSKMEDSAEDFEDSDPETSSLYSANASMLKSSASTIYSQLKNMTTEKNMKSLESAADTYTITAQTLMNSYNQLAVQTEAAEKSAEAARAAFETAEQKYALGLLTQEDLETVRETMTQSENALASLQEQAAQSQTSLLRFLGLEGQEVSVGTIPEPDLEAIEAIDFESDSQKAVNNNSTVISARHESAPGSGQKKIRASSVREAEGTAQADITASYETLTAKLTAYEGAISAWESACLTYQSLERKQQAGMLSETEYLQGVADYYEAKAEKETASMELVQAYETYSWQVKGRVQGE